MYMKWKIKKWNRVVKKQKKKPSLVLEYWNFDVDKKIFKKFCYFFNHRNLSLELIYARGADEVRWRTKWATMAASRKIKWDLQFVITVLWISECFGRKKCFYYLSGNRLFYLEKKMMNFFSFESSSGWMKDLLPTTFTHSLGKVDVLCQEIPTSSDLSWMRINYD